MIDKNNLRYDSRANSFEFVRSERSVCSNPAPPTTAERPNTYIHGKPTNPRRVGVVFKVVPASRDQKKGRQKKKKVPRKLGKSKVGVLNFSVFASTALFFCFSFSFADRLKRGKADGVPGQYNPVGNTACPYCGKSYPDHFTTKASLHNHISRANRNGHKGCAKAYAKWKAGGMDMPVLFN